MVVFIFLDYLPMIVSKYIVFAAFSIVVNIVIQYISLSFYKDIGALYIAMFLGTLAGLGSKYILDKYFIFYYKTSSHQEEVQKIFMYSLMGVGTTLLFWAVEVAFDSFFLHEFAKYVGALLGLSLGYIIKYQLDKRYVFN